MREKHPCYANGGVSGEPGEESSREIVGPLFVLEQTANNSFDDKIRTVKQAPYDERPGRTVPEAAQEHDDHEIRPRADRHNQRCDRLNRKASCRQARFFRTSRES